MATVVIHAGMPKVGSSSVQDWLDKHAGELAEGHDVQLVAALWDEAAKQLQVIPYDGRRLNSAGVVRGYLHHELDRERVLASFVEGIEREAAEHSKVVLSSEALAQPFWRVEEQFLAALEDLAARHRVRIAYYIRPQHATLESAWRQWGFRSGRSPGAYLTERSRQLHYLHSATSVAEHAPSISFEPRPFRRDLLRGGSVTADFAQHFLELDATADDGTDTWANRGLSLELVNLLSRAPQGLVWEGLHDNHGLDAVKELASELELEEREETRVSRLILEAWCHQTYESDNRRLLADLGFDAGPFVPAVADDAFAGPATLARLDELWRPVASEAELRLLWSALSRTVSPRKHAATMDPATRDPASPDPGEGAGGAPGAAGAHSETGAETPARAEAPSAAASEKPASKGGRAPARATPLAKPPARQARRARAPGPPPAWRRVVVLKRRLGGRHLYLGLDLAVGEKGSPDAGIASEQEQRLRAQKRRLRDLAKRLQLAEQRLEARNRRLAAVESELEKAAR